MTKPHLMLSTLTGSVYIVTKSRDTGSRVGGKAIMIADRKFDVTAEFDALASKRSAYRRAATRRAKKKVTPDA